MREEAEALEYLESARVKYPYLRIEKDHDLKALHIWHADFPEVLFVISWWSGKMVDDSKLSILNENLPKKPCHTVQYWDQEDSDNDMILHRCDSVYDTVRNAVWEVLRTDFENTDFTIRE